MPIEFWQMSMRFSSILEKMAEASICERLEDRKNLEKSLGHLKHLSVRVNLIYRIFQFQEFKIMRFLIL